MLKLFPSMRPKVKVDTYFLPDENGVFFRNNEGSFRMDGRTIYQWIETLIPMLDGEQSLQELTEGLSEAQRSHVYHIVEVLYENGYLRDQALERPHQLPISISERYAHQIAFLEAFSDSGGYRFQQYRNAQVLIVGGGILLTSTTAALYESGMPVVSVCVTREDGTDRGRLLEHAVYANKQDPMAALHDITEKASSVGDWEKVLEPFHGVICVSSEGDVDNLYSLESVCRYQGKHFLPVVLFEKTGLAGPMVRPGAGDGFKSVWRQLHQSTLEPEDRKCRPRSVTAAAMLANVAVFEMMKALTDVLAGAGTHQFFRLDLETMEGDWHSVLPHPLRSDEKWIALDIDLTTRVTSEDDRVQTEDLLAFFSEITSPSTGVFHRWEEGDLPQLPLSQCFVEVTDPNSSGPAATMASLICSGITHEEARIEAGFAGLEACAARIWEAESAVVGEDPVEDGGDSRVGLRREASTRTIAGTPKGTGKEGRTGGGLYSGVGMGAGRTVSEAILRGLSAWLNHQLRTQVTDRLSLAPVKNVKVKGERLLFLWDSLCAIHPQAGVALGPLIAGFPSVWIGVAEVWYGAVATNFPQAFERAITGVLAAIQNGEIKDTVARMPDKWVEFHNLVEVLMLEGQSPQDLMIDLPPKSLQDQTLQDQTLQKFSSPDAAELVGVQKKLRESGLRLVVDEFPLHEMFQEGLAGVFAVSVREEGRS